MCVFASLQKRGLKGLIYHRIAPRDPENKHSLLQLPPSLATIKDQIIVECLQQEVRLQFINDRTHKKVSLCLLTCSGVPWEVMESPSLQVFKKMCGIVAAGERFNAEYSGAALVVGCNDLKGFFQLQRFQGSVGLYRINGTFSKGLSLYCLLLLLSDFFLFVI